MGLKFEWVWNGKGRIDRVLVELVRKEKGESLDLRVLEWTVEIERESIRWL